MSATVSQAAKVTTAIHPPQFVVDANGQRTAVLMDIRSWELLSEWVEPVTDAKIVLNSPGEMEYAGGRPEQAGWLDWDQIRDLWDDDEDA